MALASRYLFVAMRAPKEMRGVRPLAGRPLRHVLDKNATDFHRDLSLDELAIVSGYSRANFFENVSHGCWKRPPRHLQDVRIEHARRQLSSTSDSITEIALKAGFSSHSHFTKAFHQNLGATPREYRRDNRF